MWYRRRKAGSSRLLRLSWRAKPANGMTKSRVVTKDGHTRVGRAGVSRAINVLAGGARVPRGEKKAAGRESRRLMVMELFNE